MIFLLWHRSIITLILKQSKTGVTRYDLLTTIRLKPVDSLKLVDSLKCIRVSEKYHKTVRGIPSECWGNATESDRMYSNFGGMP